jgi:hypothetical protein
MVSAKLFGAATRLRTKDPIGWPPSFATRMFSSRFTWPKQQTRRCKYPYKQRRNEHRVGGYTLPPWSPWKRELQEMEKAPGLIAVMRPM